MNERERLKTLYALEILDSSVEDSEFDDIVKLASRITNAPMSLITLVDEHRQWFKAKVGVGDTETAREHSFCSEGIKHDTDFFEVKNALEDERFSSNPYVIGDPNVRYYGGVPLVYNDQKLGMLCVINPASGLTDEQVQMLKLLRDHVIKLFDLRLKNKYLLMQHAEYEESEEVLKKMMGVISHDMRTPFVNVTQLIDALEDDLISDKEFRGFTTELKQSASSGLSLLEELLNWSKTMLSKEPAKPEFINLKALVETVAGQIQSNLTAKGNQLKISVPEIAVLSHRGVVSFVVRNLLVNANKFTAKGSITIEAVENADEIGLSITDSGTGMPANTVEALNTGKVVCSIKGTANERGSGFGLVLVRDYLALIKGTLHIKSTEGKGSCFKINLPKEGLSSV